MNFSRSALLHTKTEFFSNILSVVAASLHFKIKSIKSKATFLKTSFLKLQIIRLTQEHCSCTPTHWNSYFYSYICEKTQLAVHFTRVYFLSICWLKSCRFNAKIFSGCWRYKPGFLFSTLHKMIKMSKQQRFIIKLSLTYWGRVNH